MYNAAAKRPVQGIIHRAIKAKARVAKIKQLAAIHKKAASLYKASALPAGSWGHSVCGLSQTQLAEYGREAVACSGPMMKPGRCRAYQADVQDE